MKHLRFSTVLAIASVVAMIGCGGGGSSSPAPTTTPAPAIATTSMFISTSAILPAALQGDSYSTTLAAAGGDGALKWSISPAGSPSLVGWTIDPTTGVLSGVANFQGTAYFLATVTDSKGATTSKGMYVTAYPRLTFGSNQTYSGTVYYPIPTTNSFQGGVPPLHYSLASGTLPPGMHIDSVSGRITGAPLAAGTYKAMIMATDSYAKPETAGYGMEFDIVVGPLRVFQPANLSLVLNAPYWGNIPVSGGVPPYTFALTNGVLPPGISGIDELGRISGTPTQVGHYDFIVKVTDSTSTSLTQYIDLTVTASRHRNDTPQTATALSNGGVFASISPYIDPPDKAPVAGDNDYYKASSLAGSTVNITLSSTSRNPFSPVLELVDANGARLSSCRAAGDTGTVFASSCISSDTNMSPSGAQLSFLVPGAPSTPYTFYAHVLDWRGDARPDMQYLLGVNGLQAPLAVRTSSIQSAAQLNVPYTQQLAADNANGLTTWRITSGALPTGITMNSGGSISGTATVRGKYNFTAEVTDSSTPPQTASAPLTLNVAGPVTISSPATWPSECAGQHSVFAMQTTDGSAPFTWGFYSYQWNALWLDQSTGIFDGTPMIPGTYTGTVSVQDAAGTTAQQKVTVVVNSCP